MSEALALPAWVGALDVAPADDAPAGSGFGTRGATGLAVAPVAAAPERALTARFRSARLLVTRAGTPLGIVDVPVVDGRLDPAAVDDGVAAVAGVDRGPEPDPDRSGPSRPLPSTTVAVCTRDRPEHLARLLDHLAATPEPDVTVLVVDNAPSDERTRAVTAAAAARDPRVRYVREPRAGTSRARNRALEVSAADGREVVAFVDDDVTLRPGWLAAVRTAIVDRDVACVTGPVLAGTLETAAQLTSDEALGWTRAFVPRRFSLAEPSASPLFPFAPGEYGVGANFAVRTAVARAVGGFDVLLGGGSPTRGGEDIEFWVRLLAGGHALAYEPAAWLWHHHRDSVDALRAQLAGYATGLGGYLAAVACHPGMRRLALRRLPRLVGLAPHLLRLRRREAEVGVRRADGGMAPVAVVRGALTYLRVRRSRRTGS